MNRTGRLYALVEELRAAAPRPLTVAALAARFEVSTRTVQRDLQVLMETGVPVRAVAGRGGGWYIDPAMTLPPIRFTAAEAAALAVALATTDASTPYGGAARTAAQKLTATLTGPASTAAQSLATRIVTLPPPPPSTTLSPPPNDPGAPPGSAARPNSPVRADASVLAAVEQALSANAVLRLSYLDAAGRESDRTVEPAGLLTAGGRWYLIAWCRERQAGRGFRLDRITTATPTGEPARPHALTDLLHGSLAANATTPTTLTPLTHPPR